MGPIKSLHGFVGQMFELREPGEGTPSAEAGEPLLQAPFLAGEQGRDGALTDLEFGGDPLLGPEPLPQVPGPALQGGAPFRVEIGGDIGLL